MAKIPLNTPNVCPFLEVTIIFTHKKNGQSYLYILHALPTEFVFGSSHQRYFDSALNLSWDMRIQKDTIAPAISQHHRYAVSTVDVFLFCSEDVLPN
jgi:hypothetical protein